MAENNEKLRELIAAGDELAHSKNWPPKKADAEMWDRRKAELEAVLAESVAGQAQLDAERKIACRAIEWEGCPCSDTRDALKGAIEEWRALAQPAAAKEKVASPVEGESVVVTTVPSSYSTSNGPSYDPWAAKEKDEPIPCPTCGSIECCGLTCGPSGEPTREVPQRHELPAGHTLSEEQVGTVCLKHDALPSNLTAFVTDLNALLRASQAGSQQEVLPKPENIKWLIDASNQAISELSKQEHLDSDTFRWLCNAVGQVERDLRRQAGSKPAGDAQ